MRVLDDDSTETVTLEHVEQARKQMVDARETHLDALSKRLRDPRIKPIIQSILTTETDIRLTPENPDVQYAMDMGLVVFDTDKGFAIANPLYEEMLIRELDGPYFYHVPSPASWRWQAADGSLDMDALMHEFQDFWQSNSERWEEMSDYTEAFPHLLMLAFLQRVTNGNGHIHREYPAGSGRMDIAVEFKGKWNIIEIKMRRAKQTYEWVRTKGLEQIRKYRERFPKAEGSYLVIFDRRPEANQLDWSERLKWENEGDVVVCGL